MAENKNQEYNNLNSEPKINIYTKGLIKDYNDSYIPEGVWTNAINAVTNSHQGDMYTIGNEPSNTFCTRTDFEIIGIIRKNATEWFVFSTNNIASEIGTFDESDCSYTKHVFSGCLGFKTSNLISGATQVNYDCTYSVFFADGLNPDRVFNPDKIPYLVASYDTTDPNCPIPIYDDPPRLDCDKLRLQYLIDLPCFTLENSNSPGTLFNGTYQVTVAYSINGQRVTDYFTLSNPASIWTHENNGGSLDLVFTTLDLNFQEYEVVLISTVAERTTARRIGFFSTTQQIVHIDDNTDALVTIPLEDIPIRLAVYDTSDSIYSLNYYLLRKGVKAKPEFNYQPLANQIVTKWVSIKYPSDYYIKGGNNPGYMRDEVYSFFIRWVYNTGDRSASYHIPGRPAVATDLVAAGGPDFIPYDNPGFTTAPTWKIYNTATVAGSSGTVLPDGGVVTATGFMSYWESADKYPVNPSVWNSSAYTWSQIGTPPYNGTVASDYDLCGDSIRHHKFPDDAIAPLFDTPTSVIQVMGVTFQNIKSPVDQNGNPIPGIVGYEILRGSREGNKSIVGKGLIYNMAKYTDPALPGTSVLYQNYPFNCLQPDYFLRTGAWYTPARPQDYDYSSNPMNAFRADYFTFHSPEFVFRSVYLNPSEIRIYKEYQGTARGSFVEPIGHPKHKIPSYGAFIGSLLLGLGLTIQQFVGKKTTVAGNIADPASLAANNAAGAGGLAGGLTGSVSSTLQGSIGWWGGTAFGLANGTMTGLMPPQIHTEDTGLSSLNFTSKKGNTVAQILGYLQQISMIAQAGTFFMAQNFGSVYKAFKELLPWIQYARQYNGVGAYTNAINVARGNQRRAINKARYIGDGIQQFDPTYIVNNIHRPKTVAINTAGTFSNPIKQDTSRKTIFQLKIWNNPGATQLESISAYYAGLKINNPSQYGQVNGIVQVPIGTCVQPKATVSGASTQSQIYFGGDVYINRYTELNKFSYFTNWLYDQPNGTDFDYKQFANIPYPRFWCNFSDFDIGDIKILPGFPSFSSGFSLFALIQFIANLVKFFIGLIRNPLSIITTLVGGPSEFFHLDRDIRDYGFLGNIKQIFKIALNVKRAYFYLFNNGVKDFYCESEINLACRDYGEQISEQFYNPYGFSNINLLFKTDLITVPEFFKYDFSMSAGRLLSTYVSWGSMLPIGYDPDNQFCTEYYPNRLIYSLQQQEEQSRDNWRIYLANNYKEFESRITNVKSINRTGAVILFEDAIPTTINGVDELRTSAGNRITVGDAGLFNQSFQNLVNADLELEYGSCQSERSVINTPYGVFWISQRNGKIMHLFNNQITDISMNGMRFWFIENLQYNLLKSFPNYPFTDNPVKGIGCQTVYDNQFEIVYFTKKDYTPNPSYNIVYDEDSGEFVVVGYKYETKITYGGPTSTAQLKTGKKIVGTINGQAINACTYTDPNIVTFLGCLVNEMKACFNIKDVFYTISPYDFTLTVFLKDDTIPAILSLAIENAPGPVAPPEQTPITFEVFTSKNVQLTDPEYFNSCSWTVSYDPKVKAWVSFHDWHPDLMFPSNDHFYTILNNEFWKHNDRCDSFNNYYNQTFGWEVEFPVNTQSTVTTIKSIEYYLEVFQYNQGCNNKYHILDGNFDQAVLYNSEQVSGILNLYIKPKNNPAAMLAYPKTNLTSYDILVAKEENKYRFNQFWDITKDRGELSGKQITNFITECNGYRININPTAIDYNKPLIQRKKFRHYGNRVILRKMKSGSQKMNLKVVATKETLSPR